MDERIINRTRKQTLHERPRYATTVWQQAKGLMFRRPSAEDCVVFLFLPARPVRFHMWFVFGPLDILALDGQGRVIALKEDFRPWTLWNPGVTASAVVELPPGTIKMTGTQVGDIVAVPSRRL